MSFLSNLSRNDQHLLLSISAAIRYEGIVLHIIHYRQMSNLKPQSLGRGGGLEWKTGGNGGVD